MSLPTIIRMVSFFVTVPILPAPCTLPFRSTTKLLQISDLVEEVHDVDDRLALAPQPVLLGVFRGLERDLLAVDGDLARIGTVDAAEDVRERRLAGTVNADQADEAFQIESDAPLFTPGCIHRAAPGLGQDTQAILAELQIEAETLD